MVAAYVPNGGGQLRTIIMLHEGELLHPKWNDNHTAVWLMDHGRPVEIIKEVDQILPWGHKWLLTPPEFSATVLDMTTENTQSDVVVPPASGGESEAV